MLLCDENLMCLVDDNTASQGTGWSTELMAAFYRRGQDEL